MSTAAAKVLASPLAGSHSIAFRRLRTSLFYWWRHWRWPALEQPQRFTEWVQWRKLYDRDVGLARLTDKLHAKVAAGELAVPTLWSGTQLPEAPPGPLPLMVKANHGCNQFMVVRTPADWVEARRRAPRWLTRSYGRMLDEWHYRAARWLLLVEPFLGGEGAALPLDYKVYVFAGRAQIVQLHAGRGAKHHWTQFDRAWTPLSNHPISAPAPGRLAEMLAAAERLAGQRDFLRVDFYEIDGRLWFGEFCLFPGSGLDPFRPDALDLALGRRWSAARAASA
ncbi:MAG: ATP-grasp fold amidoligase family protein [Sphingomicrobium sp.]